MQTADVAAARLPASATVGALIERRLKALSPEAVALARLAAVAGPDFSPALAEAVTGRPALAMADAWAELEAAQVLRERAFAHDLVWEAAHRGIPQPIAEHLHAAVARHLQASGAEPARLAAHWLAARDEAAALPQLLRAADAARDAMRRREEAEFVERAAQIAAQAAVAGQPSAFELYLRASNAREYVEGVDSALPLLDRALQNAASAADRARVLALRAHAHTKRYELGAAVVDFRAALAHALEVGDDRVSLDTVHDLAEALSFNEQHVEAVALLEQHVPRVQRQSDPGAHWFAQHALVLDNAGRPHEARPFHQKAMTIALRRGDHADAIVIGNNMAVGDIDVGEVERAAEQLADNERLRLAHDRLDGVNVAPWGLQALVWRELGRYRQALDAGERMLAADAAQRPARLPMDRLQRAWLWYWLGQWTRALQDLLPDAAYAEVPAYVGLRALQLRHRIASARRMRPGDALQRAAAGLDAQMLRTMRESIALDAALASGDLARAESLRAAAEADAFYGLRWSAEWVCARLCLDAGDAQRAREHAAACMDRPPRHTPVDLAAGTWWHGLWQVWRGLGDRDLADVARAEGVAWIHRTLQRELPSEFHAGFRDAVPAHRALLAG